MSAAPQVAIVIPLFNDEEYVAAALDSCVNQTLAEIEIICVDDASTDSTVSILEEYRSRDSRIQVIQQPSNLSAFQARRAGVMAASAPYVLFLDGDDELSPDAARTVLGRAGSTGADLVGFGVDIVAPDEGFPHRFQAALQPRHSELRAPGIIPGLFPAGEVANGHLWRYLFATELLRMAYERTAESATYYRANDLPITFLAIARAKKYVSVPERLYRYHFRRGTSGHPIDGVEHFEFLLSGVEPISAIADEVRELARGRVDADALLRSYESARLHIIGNVLRYCTRDTSGELQRTCLMMLKHKVGDMDVIRAAAAFVGEALGPLSSLAEEPSQPKTVKSVLLTTAHLATGGLQGVLLEHARMLIASGHRVTIAVMRDSADAVDLIPEGVALVEVAGDGKVGRLDRWRDICREYDVDLIIDHHVLYNENWPWFTLMALASGVPTIGWVHNFALRPIFDGTQRVTFLTTHMRLLLRVVTLSPTDVAFWKLRGLERVVFLPNPPSRLTIAALESCPVRLAPDGHLELAWWGRLDRTTKQVLQLVDVAARLRERGVDFRLTIIGPDSQNLRSRQVARYAAERGVEDAIDLLGELGPDDLLAALSSAHLLVSTSAIEGYQLTIIEAQAMGMPVVMQDLPWLATVRGNEGLVATAPGDAVAMADAIAHLANDPDCYERLSLSARQFAEATVAVDLLSLLNDLVSGRLAPAFSPEPTSDDARILVEWLVRIAERNIRGVNRGRRNSDAEIAALRRQRDRARRKLEEITRGPSFRMGRVITYVPRKLSALMRKPAMPSPSPRPRAVTQSGAAPKPLRGQNAGVIPDRSATPDVSFVIPVYNSALWIDDCVSSVLAQTDVSVEVICIDDGSTDDSLSILRRLADADPRITVLDQPNSGQSVGRNRGVDHARGRYVIYLDSDDYWPEDALSDMVRRADAERLDMLLFDCSVFRDGDIKEESWQWYSTYYQRSGTYRAVTSGVELMAMMRRGRDYRPHVGLYMTRLSFLRDSRVRFIPGIVHQDNPYTFRLLLRATRATHEPVDAYARRLRPGSTITTLTADRSARGYYLSYLEMVRELESSDLPKETEGAVRNIVDYVYDGALKQFAQLSDAVAEELREIDDAPDAMIVFESLRRGESQPR